MTEQCPRCLSSFFKVHAAGVCNFCVNHEVKRVFFSQMSGWRGPEGQRHERVVMPLHECQLTEAKNG